MGPSGDDLVAQRGFVAAVAVQHATDIRVQAFTFTSVPIVTERLGPRLVEAVITGDARQPVTKRHQIAVGEVFGALIIDELHLARLSNPIHYSKYNGSAALDAIRFHSVRELNFSRCHSRYTPALR